MSWLAYAAGAIVTLVLFTLAAGVYVLEASEQRAKKFMRNWGAPPDLRPPHR